MRKTEKPKMLTGIQDVDFSSFKLKQKEISINGKPLPLKIGDRIQISENDAFYKTVVGISVFEDSRVQYMLEWYDASTGNFASEMLTLTELKLLSQNTKAKKRQNVGFSDECDNNIE